MYTIQSLLVDKIKAKMSSWPMIFDTVVKGLTGVAQVVTLMEKGRCCALQWTDKKNQDGMKLHLCVRDMYTDIKQRILALLSESS